MPNHHVSTLLLLMIAGCAVPSAEPGDQDTSTSEETRPQEHEAKPTEQNPTPAGNDQDPLHPLPLEFKDVLVRAFALGKELLPIKGQVADEIGSNFSLDKQRQAMRNAFGPELPRNGFVHGACFKVEGGRQIEFLKGCNYLETYPNLGPAFFYEPTLINLDTGEVFQGIWSYAGWQGAQFFGPLQVSESARIVGSFTQEERAALQERINAAILE